MLRRVLVPVIAVLTAAVPVVLTADPASAALTRVFETSYPGLNFRSSPTIADVNGDGVNDIVVGDRNGVVHAVNSQGGDLPGWPKQFNIGGTNTGIEATPAVGDLDNDGKNEVVVGAGLLDNPNQHGGVQVFNGDGSLRCTFQTKDRAEGANGFSDPVHGSPAIGDVSGDGFPDIVFGSFDHEVYVIDRNCGQLGSFFNNDTVFSGPALFDIDFDKRMEIWIGADSSGTFAPNGGIMRLIEFQGSTLQQRWQFNIGEIIQSSPALGDIDGDGLPEVVFGAGDFWQHPDGNRVYALNAETGSPVPGFPVTLDGRTIGSPALGDLNGDGRLDIAIASFGKGGTPSKLHGIRHDGGVLWSVNPGDGTRFNQGDLTNSPIIADVDGNGNNEVIIPGGSSGFVRNGANGSLNNTFDEDRQHINAAAVGMFGSQWMLVSASFLQSDNTNRIAAYSIPAPGTAPPWPMYRMAANHQASPPPLVPSGAGGYYVLDENGDIYAFGKARHFGSVPIQRLHGVSIGPAASVGISGTSDGNGYFVLDDKGGMFTYGNAQFFGSVPGLKNAGVPTGEAPSIALAVTSNNQGYYVLDAKGGMFTFGNAAFFGSVPGEKQTNPSIGDAPALALAVTANNGGYWILDNVGGMFTFGNATFFGSVPQRINDGIQIGNAKIVGMAPTPSGQGYWMVDEIGGLHAFGDAGFFGSIPALRNAGTQIGDAKIIGMVATPSGQGYWLFDSKGGIFAFGDAVFVGSLPGVGVNTNAVGVTPYRGP